MTQDFFDDVVELPDPGMGRQFRDLVGLDEIKALLLKEARLLLNPQFLDEWSQKNHGTILPGVNTFHQRPPLILFSGDVGTGKTTLAESFGDPIARDEKIRVTVLRLSLMTRGRGAVGEMTHLLSQAFAEVEALASRGAAGGKKAASATILIIDEADALAESRDVEEMHHEDRAGVNALIRGIDRLSRKRLPVLIVLCTNREAAIDPAVLRRAAAHYRFERPNAEQRAVLIQSALGDIFSEGELEKLAELTGPRESRPYGYTYSDITGRLVPRLLLEAFPDSGITFSLAAAVVEKTPPTRPFGPAEQRADPS